VIELCAAPVTFVAFLMDALGSAGAATAALAMLTCAIHTIRLIGWRSYRAYHPPILTVLHLAYAWIPGSFFLLGLSALGYVSHTLAMHAFTTGVIGGAIIAMITRTSRGHTGRPLVADRRDVCCYLLVTAGANLRVVGPMVIPAHTMFWIYAAGICWVVAFTLYVAAYASPLLRPRADGKPG
jgi:uncharacterized protein involved in response to NO